MAIKRQLMIDTETLSLRKDALVFQIGATIINGSGLGDFYCTVNPIKLILDHGMFQNGVDEATVRWHTDKNFKNWAAACSVEFDVTLVDMMKSFHDYVVGFIKGAEGAGVDYEIWCRGTDFDIPVLTSMFERFGMEVPWKYNKVRDLRTAIALLGDPGVPKPEGAHNALVDATYQAMQLEMMQKP